MNNEEKAQLMVVFQLLTKVNSLVVERITELELKQRQLKQSIYLHSKVIKILKEDIKKLKGGGNNDNSSKKR